MIVADADVWCDGLQEAVSAVENGAAWARPHRNVLRLTERATTAFLAGEEVPPEYTQPPYHGVWGGGYVIAQRDTLLDVPPDALFQNWGNEDESWAFALDTLSGPGWSGDADLIHLFHPPAPRWTRRRGSRENWTRYGLYRAAQGDRTAMRELVEEGRPAE